MQVLVLVLAIPVRTRQVDLITAIDNPCTCIAADL